MELKTSVAELYRWYNWGICLSGGSFKQC